MLCTFIVPTGAVAFTNAHFGAGFGPIYLDTVDCTGSESNLTDCFRSFIVSCSSHSEDAGVRCQGELHLDSITIYSVHAQSFNHPPRSNHYFSFHLWGAVILRI